MLRTLTVHKTERILAVKLPLYSSSLTDDGICCDDRPGALSRR
jgi:hypothetical protein